MIDGLASRLSAALNAAFRIEQSTWVSITLTFAEPVNRISGGENFSIATELLLIDLARDAHLPLLDGKDVSEEGRDLLVYLLTAAFYASEDFQHTPQAWKLQQGSPEFAPIQHSSWKTFVI